MPDAPQLPDSPLKVLRDEHLGPRAAIWRRRTLTVSIGLIGTFSAGAFAFWVFFGVLAWSTVEASVVAGIPSLLLGLVGLQIALGRPGNARSVTVLAALLAVACLIAHLWLLQDLDGLDVGLLVRFAPGIAGDGAVIMLPVVRRTRIARQGTAAAVLACALGPTALAWQSAHELSVSSSIWYRDAISHGAAPMIPILGALVLFWLLFTEPRE